VETLTTKITSAVDLTPASEAAGKVKVQFQGNVLRTKTELTEAMNKTGTIVQRRITQGVQEAKVVVEKVR
jgi:phosphopantothenate synthetase